MKSLFWPIAVMFTFFLSCKKSDKMSLATLTTTAASVITSSTAQSGGDITSNGGSNISKRGVCYAMHSGPTVSDSVTIDGSGTGTYTSSLSNLISNATYYARAYAINADGTAYGNELSFVTAKGLATVTTTAVTNIAPLVAYSGGNVISDGGATVSTRGLCWSTSPHPTTSNFKTSDSSGTGIFVDTIVNLASQATYYVRAYATNSFGTAYGNEISFPSASATTVTDIEGNIYGTMVIGTQTWTTSNLRTAHYQNGDTLVNGSATNFDWWGNSNHQNVGVYTFPMGDSAQRPKYGLLYNNAAVNDSRNICPAGWHVPSDPEWDVLCFNQGMTAADTANRVNTPQQIEGRMAGKLLEGGSSGLNLQDETGYFFFDLNNTGNHYGDFGSNGTVIFLTATLDPDAAIYFIGQPLPLNFERAFNESDEPSGSIFRFSDFQHVVSLRCIKN